MQKKIKRGMNSKVLGSVITFLAAVFMSCNFVDVDDHVTPLPGLGTFINHGEIPANVDAGVNVAEFQSAIYSNNYVYVATNDGIWKNNIATKEWTKAGLQGISVSAIYKHPMKENRFFAGVRSDLSAGFKTLYISKDGGETWQAGNELPFIDSDQRYENFYSFAVRPGYPDHIYANIEGSMIAVSTDGGANWSRMNYESDTSFGYQSKIVFVPGISGQIFQGSERPLDFAWLGRYSISYSDPVLLSGFTKIIDENTFKNRRPVELRVFPNTGNSIFVGQEGALSKVTGNQQKFIYKSEDGSTMPYTYVYAVWVNPDNPEHLMFGGALNHNEQPMQLFETYDEGTTIHRFTNKMGFDNPEIMEIISTDNYPAILINDQNADRVGLILYKPEEFKY